MTLLAWGNVSGVFFFYRGLVKVSMKLHILYLNMVLPKRPRFIKINLVLSLGFLYDQYSYAFCMSIRLDAPEINKTLKNSLCVSVCVHMYVRVCVCAHVCVCLHVDKSIPQAPFIFLFWNKVSYWPGAYQVG